MAELATLTRLLGRHWSSNVLWMGWNLTLALVPLALSVVLFRRQSRPGALWCVGVAAFLAFLPNAPYVLTDVVHLVHDVRNTRSDRAVVFAVLPQYALFFLAGFTAYVLAVRNLTSYVRRATSARHALAVEIVVHGICAVGVYVGRFLRFNSWDLVTRPDAVASTAFEDLARRYPLVLVALTVVVLVVGTTLLRWLLEAVAAHVRALRAALA